MACSQAGERGGSEPESKDPGWDGPVRKRPTAAPRPGPLGAADRPPPTAKGPAGPLPEAPGRGSGQRARWSHATLGGVRGAGRRAGWDVLALVRLSEPAEERPVVLLRPAQERAERAGQAARHQRDTGPRHRQEGREL